MKKIIFILLFSAICGLGSYAQNDSWVWAHNGVGSGKEEPNSICTDGNGNVYVTGNFSDPTISFGPTLSSGTITLTNSDPAGITHDIFVIKYDPNGNVLWANSAGGLGDDDAFSIAADQAGNVYITGSFNSNILPTYGISTVGGYDYFIAKYNGTSGAFIWAQSAGGAQNDQGVSISIDNNSTNVGIYVTGSYKSSSITFGSTTLTNSSTGFIVKYNTSGVVQFAISTGNLGMNDAISSIFVTDDGFHFYITGSFISNSLTFGTNTITNINSGTSDIFLVEYYYPNNTPTIPTIGWARREGGIGNDYSSSVKKYGAAGSIYLTGGFDSPSISFASSTIYNSGFTDILLLKFDGLGGPPVTHGPSTGNPITGVSIGGAGNDAGYSLSIDNSENIYVTGGFNYGWGNVNAPMYFSNIVNSSSSYITPVSGTNPIIDPAFVLKLNASFTTVLSSAGLASGGDDAFPICTYSTGIAYVAGDYMTTPYSIGSFPFTTSGYENAFVARYGSTPCSVNTYNYSTIASNQSNVVFGSNPVISNANIHVTQDLYISSSIEFQFCNIVVDPGKKIILQSGKNLIVSKKTHIYGAEDCSGVGTRWGYIQVPDPATTLTIDQAIIEDADSAVYSSGGGKYVITNSIFNKNYVGVAVTQCAGIHTGTINSTVFTSRNLNLSSVVNLNPVGSSLVAALTSANANTVYPLSNILGACYKSVMGVEVTNVGYTSTSSSNFSLGDATNSSFLNLFDNVGTGIYLRKTSATVYNNTFQNMVTTGACVLPSTFLNTGIYASGKKGINNYSIKIGDAAPLPATYSGSYFYNPTNSSNKFTDVFQGVWVNFYQTNNVLNNTFSNTITPTSGIGIEILPSDNNNLDVNLNYVSNFNTGIWIQRNTGAGYNGTQNNQNTHIEFNRINGRNSGYCAYAIRLTDQPNSISTHSIKIQYNDIYAVRNGIVADNVLQQLIIAHQAPSYVSGISLVETTSPVGSGSGIQLNSCKGAFVQENTINSVAGVGAALTNYTGIYVISSPVSTVECNVIDQVGQSMLFKSGCFPSYVYNNAMSNGVYGLKLDQQGFPTTTGNIGPQGSYNGVGSGFSSGNTWAGFVGSGTYTSGGAVPNLSKIYGSLSAAPTNGAAPLNTAYINGSYSGTTLVPANSTYIGIPTGVSHNIFDCSSLVQNITPQFHAYSQQELKDLAFDSTQYAQYQEELQYFNKLAAYNILDTTDVLTRDTLGLLQAFYDSAKAAPLGKLIDVENYIKNSNYTAAKTKNNEVVPSNDIETNKKLFNYYYLLPADDSTFHYSPDDSSGIYSIAAQCPSEAGTIVWQARALYYNIINNLVDFEDNCDAIGKSLIHKTSKPSTDISNNFNLFPNPNNGFMTLEYKIRDNESGVFSLYDITGKQISSNSLNSGNNSLKVDASTLDAGVYYYEVKVGDKRVKTDKLIILK